MSNGIEFDFTICKQIKSKNIRNKTHRVNNLYFGNT